MTEAQKKMKKYVNAVERKLNLPREIKARVMSDFLSAIQARRESGMTDDEIYAELGTPKEAASELNEQMKEFTYRKSPWRFLFAGCAAYGAGRLLSQIFAKVSLWMVMGTSPEAASIGIIGGADGPTAIFVTAAIKPVYHDLLMALVIAVGIYGFLRLRKCKKK